MLLYGLHQQVQVVPPKKGKNVDTSLIVVFVGIGLVVMGLVPTIVGASNNKNVWSDAPPKLDLGIFGITAIFVGVLVVIVGALLAIIA